MPYRIVRNYYQIQKHIFSYCVFEKQFSFGGVLRHFRFQFIYCIFEKKNRLGALLEIFVSSLFIFSAGKLSHNIRPLSFSLSFSLISLFISFSFPLIPLSFSLISFNFPFAFFYFPFISFTFPFRCFCFHLNSKKKRPTNVAVSLLNSLLKS